MELSLIKKLITLCAVLPLLNACSTTYHSPASIALCETMDVKQWTPSSGSSYKIEMQGIQYYFDFNDKQDGLISSKDTSQVFWI